MLQKKDLFFFKSFFEVLLAVSIVVFLELLVHFWMKVNALYLAGGQCCKQSWCFSSGALP